MLVENYKAAKKKNEYVSLDQTLDGGLNERKLKKTKINSGPILERESVENDLILPLRDFKDVTNNA